MADSKNNITMPVVLTGLGGLILGAALGFGITRTSLVPSPAYTTTVVDKTNATDDSVFTDQTAMINAKVTQIVNDKISVETVDRKQATFNVATPVYINNQLTNQTKSATSSATLAEIPLNQFTILNLRKIQGEYKVFSVIIPPQPGSPPPAPPTPKSTTTP